MKYEKHWHRDVDVFTGSRPDPTDFSGPARLAVLPGGVKDFVINLYAKGVKDEDIFIHSSNKFLFFRYYVDWNE